MRNYVIIGGSSGIGKELVGLLKGPGVNILATYNKHVVEESDDHIKYHKFDALSDTLNIDDMPEKIHGLAYCPGSINLKPFHRFTDNDFMADFQLQVLGATKVIQLLLPRIRQGGDSSIVLFSTIAVQHGFNFHAQVAISKGAIEGLTRALAAEFAPKIRVNAVAPSLTNTSLAEKFLSSPDKIKDQSEKNPLKRVGSAIEVAEAAAYLLTPKSSWVTGQILPVDGGFSSIK